MGGYFWAVQIWPRILDTVKQEFYIQGEAGVTQENWKVLSSGQVQQIVYIRRDHRDERYSNNLIFNIP